MGSLLNGQRDPSGLEYRRNRYYDPQSGRFTQEDPIGLAGGLNLYGFAGGDPLNFDDPFGLDSLKKGTYVGCRNLNSDSSKEEKGSTGSPGARHCAVRTIDDNGDQVGELLNNGDKNDIGWRNTTERDQNLYTWVAVPDASPDKVRTAFNAYKKIQNGRK